MRIVIDMQGLQTSYSAHRGVGRYTEQLVRHLLLTAAGQHEVFLAMNGSMPEAIDRIRTRFTDLVPDDRFLVWQQFYDTTERLEPPRWLVEAGELLREASLNRVNPDVIFAPNLQEGWSDSAVTSVRRFPSAALYCSTLHDLVPFNYKNEYLGDPALRDWYFTKIEQAKASDVLVTVSKTSRGEIAKHLGLAPERVAVVENGYDKELFCAKLDSSERISDVHKSYGIEGDFLFYVGGNDLHKNIWRLLSAYALLPADLRKTTLLVLAGREFARDERLHDRISELGLEGRVLTPGFVTDEDLPVLLRSCVCFVFPSTHEGFGLPALEAMACGAPVIGAAGSAVEEVIGDKRAVFDPFSVQDMSDRLAQVLGSEHLRAELAQQGLVRAEYFSWEKAAKSLWTVLEKALEKRPHWVGATSVTEQSVIGMLAALKPLQQNDMLRAVVSSLAESFPPHRPSAVFLDISRVVEEDHRTGIQRVTRAIVQELAGKSFLGRDLLAVYGSHEAYGFREANHYMREKLGLDRPEKDAVVDFAAGDMLVFLDLHPGLAIRQQEYTKYLRRKGVKVMHVVYDLIPVLRPELFWPELCAEFQNWLRVVCSSDGAVCISRAVAQDLRAHMSREGLVSPHSFGISYFHLGADLESSVPTLGMPEGAQELLNRLASTESFLMVGTIEPRKGHRLVLAAFEHLWQAGVEINLVIVGRQGWSMEPFVKHLQHHSELGRRLVYLQQISDEFLGDVYGACSCLIAASECEGFGLPLIEAAQYNLPIIARDIAVFREVATEHAYYFKAHEPIELAEAIQNWLALYEKSQHPSSKNMPWLTWKQSAAQLLKALGLSAVTDLQCPKEGLQKSVQ